MLHDWKKGEGGSRTYTFTESHKTAPSASKWDSSNGSCAEVSRKDIIRTLHTIHSNRN